MTNEEVRLSAFKNWAFSWIFENSDRTTFLVCFRLFQKPNTLLELLLEEYQECKKNERHDRRRVIEEFVVTWMRGFHEYDLDRATFKKWLKLCEDQDASNRCKLILLRHASLSRRETAFKVQTRLQCSTPAQFLEHLAANGISSTPLHVHSTSTIAHALTRIELELLLNITPSELLVWTWQKNEDHQVPNIHQLSARFNEVSYWAATEILLCDGIHDQGAALTKILKIAKKCDRLNNFTTLMALMSGVNHVAVTRLKGIWECVPSKLLHWFREAEEMMLPSSNFKNYRTQLKKRKSPIIPYTALVMKDLTFLAEGNDMYAGDQVNAEFIELLQTQLTQLTDLQADLVEYQLRDEGIAEQMKILYHADDEQLYKWSQDTVQSQEPSRKVSRNPSSATVSLSPRQSRTMDGVSAEALRDRLAEQEKRKSVHRRHSSVDI